LKQYLVFTQQWKMQEDFKWLSVGSHDNQLGLTTVQGLGGYHPNHHTTPHIEQTSWWSKIRTPHSLTSDKLT
jgi:hypothetical protein